MENVLSVEGQSPGEDAAPTRPSALKRDVAYDAARQVAAHECQRDLDARLTTRLQQTAPFNFDDVSDEQDAVQPFKKHKAANNMKTTVEYTIVKGNSVVIVSSRDSGTTRVEEVTTRHHMPVRGIADEEIVTMPIKMYITVPSREYESTSMKIALGAVMALFQESAGPLLKWVKDEVDEFDKTFGETIKDDGVKVEVTKHHVYWRSLNHLEIWGAPSEQELPKSGPNPMRSSTFDVDHEKQDRSASSSGHVPLQASGDADMGAGTTSDKDSTAKKEDVFYMLQSSLDGTTTYKHWESK
jgi:hypothetical protein